MPTVEFRLLNVFLRPDEFAVLPLEVIPLWDDLGTLSSDEKDPRRPVPTALCQVPLAGLFDTPEKANSAVYWLVTLLGFLTRRPTGADLQVTVGDTGEQVAWRPLKGVPPQMRDGQEMFRNPAELRTVFDAAWGLWAEESPAARRLHRALDWHNMARSGTGDAPLDLSLIEHWIAIESLAADWARARSVDQLLSAAQVQEVATELDRMALGWELPPDRAQELTSKMRELARRPVVPILAEYIRSVLAPYDEVQPLESDLTSLIRTTIDWRNRVVHTGELQVDRIKGGVDSVWFRMRQLDSLTERVLLACLGAEITYLKSVPWTYIMVAA
jgi:hypothetical protein